MKWRRKIVQIVACSLCMALGGEAFVQAKEEMQWYLQEIGQEEKEQENLEENTMEPVVIAVIDTGVYTSHAALKDSLWTNESELYGEEGVDDDNNGYIDDIHGYNIKGKNGNVMDTDGHGTHIAGIIGMKPTANNAYQGVFPEAKLMIVKAGNTSNGFTSANLIKGIKYAIENKADVINLSLGTSYCTEELREAIEEASKNAVIVASAGNHGVATSESGYQDAMNIFPAGLEGVIGVMSFNQEKEFADFSNWDYKEGTEVDYEVVAPGKDIYSTTLYNKYKYESGTSMSTAIVSAICGRVITEWEKQEEIVGRWTPKQIRECILVNAKEYISMLDREGKEHRFPRVSLKNALDYFQEEYYLRKLEAMESVVTGSGVVSASPITTPNEQEERNNEVSLVPVETEETGKLESPVPVGKEETEHLASSKPEEIEKLESPVPVEPENLASLKPEETEKLESPVPVKTEETGNFESSASEEKKIIEQKTEAEEVKISEIQKQMEETKTVEEVENKESVETKEETNNKENRTNTKEQKQNKITKQKPKIKICKQKKNKVVLKYHIKKGNVSGYYIYYGKNKKGKFVLLERTRKKSFLLKNRKKGYYYVVAYYKTKEQMYFSKKSLLLKQ